MRSRLFGALAGVLALALLGVPAAAVQQQNLPAVKPSAAGGQPFGSGSEIAVVVGVVGGECTGALVEPRIVVTAAHCVLDVSSNALGPMDDYVVFGPGADFDAHTAEFDADVKQIFVGPFRWDPAYHVLENPDWVSSLTAEQYWAEFVPRRAQIAAGDYAVLVLTEPLPLETPVEVSTTESRGAFVRANPRATAVGYGTGDSLDLAAVPSSLEGTAYVDVAALPGAGDPQTEERDALRAGIEIQQGLVALQLDAIGDGLCGGDSGGPLLQRVDGRYVVLGVLAEAGRVANCEDRRGQQGKRQLVAYAGGSGLVELVQQARQVVAGDPIPAGYCETIVEPGDEDYGSAECWDGKRWASEGCYKQPRLRLERFDNGRWVRAADLKGKRNKDDCTRFYPYAHRFPEASPMGGTTYRLVDPKRKKVLELIMINRYGPS